MSLSVRSTVRSLMIATTAAALVTLAQPARADVYGVVGNDTGGIIPWSPLTEQYRWEIAARHCAWYRKYPKISSVYRQYGNYIGFHCLFGPPVGTAIITRY